MKQYRKKPVLVQAIPVKDIISFVTMNAMSSLPEEIQQKINSTEWHVMSTSIDIVTPEGVMTGDYDDMIIRGVNGEYYPCKPDIFEKTYDNAEENSTGKTLHNSNISGARKNVKDIKVVGDGDMFKLLCKASSEAEGWMKSTKAMETATGCVVQVTTQQRNKDGSYAVAEALTFVPHVKIIDDMNNGRKLSSCIDFYFPENKVEEA